jgi:hypothetical protein
MQTLTLPHLIDHFHKVFTMMYICSEPTTLPETPTKLPARLAHIAQLESLLQDLLSSWMNPPTLPDLANPIRAMLQSQVSSWYLWHCSTAYCILGTACGRFLLCQVVLVSATCVIFYQHFVQLETTCPDHSDSTAWRVS